MLYTFEDLISKIEYIPYDYNNNLKKVLKYLDPNGSDSFANWTTITYSTEGKTKCVCSHDIQYQLFAHHNTTQDRILIGSKCVGLFSDEHQLTVNRLIRMKNDPTGIYCGICSKKTQGTEYHTSCLQKRARKCLKCGKFEGYGCECPRCKSCCALLKSTESWKIRCYGCYLEKKREGEASDKECAEDIKWYRSKLLSENPRLTLQDPVIMPPSPIPDN